VLKLNFLSPTRSQAHVFKNMTMDFLALSALFSTFLSAKLTRRDMAMNKGSSLDLKEYSGTGFRSCRCTQQKKHMMILMVLMITYKMAKLGNKSGPNV
jgi:hypothetical protein